KVTDDDRAAVERRRLFPTRVTQRVQVFVQNNVLSRVLASRGDIRPPWPVRMLGRHPLLQRIPARLVGLGIRPEHVHTPELAPAPQGEQSRLPPRTFAIKFGQRSQGDGRVLSAEKNKVLTQV